MLTSSEKTGSEVGRQLSGDEDMLYAIQPFDTPVSLSAGGGLPDIVIFDVRELGEDRRKEIEEIMVANRGRLTVMGVGDTADAAVMQWLIKLGAMAAVTGPSNEVYSLCREVLDEKRSGQSGKQGIVCSIMSAKGGCGATTIAVNTAVVLASTFKARVCLVDFDIGFGGCAHMLNLKPKQYVTDALDHVGGSVKGTMRDLVATHSSGLDVMASPPNPLIGNERIDPAKARKLVEALARTYEIVIVDLPRTTADWAAEILKQSDRKFVVIQNYLSAIREARLLSNAFSSMGVRADDMELIINRSMSRFSSLATSDVGKHAAFDVMHKIRNDYSSATAASDSGEPLHGVFRRSEILDDIRELSKSIWGDHPKSKEEDGSLFQKIITYASKRHSY